VASAINDLFKKGEAAIKLILWANEQPEWAFEDDIVDWWREESKCVGLKNLK
jgi:hypothetical protein